MGQLGRNIFNGEMQYLHCIYTLTYCLVIVFLLEFLEIVCRKVSFCERLIHLPVFLRQSGTSPQKRPAANLAKWNLAIALLHSCTIEAETETVVSENRGSVGMALVAGKTTTTDYFCAWCFCVNGLLPRY